MVDTMKKMKSVDVYNGEMIYNKGQTLFGEVAKETPEIVYANDELLIYIPSIARRVMEDYMRSILSDTIIDINKFRGIKVVDGYERAIVIAHKRAIENPYRKLVFKATI